MWIIVLFSAEGYIGKKYYAFATIIFSIIAKIIRNRWYNATKYAAFWQTYPNQAAAYS